MRKKRTSVVHRICTLVGSLFCFILIPLLLINCTLIIKSITNKNEVPDIGGIFPMVILTDSMNPQLASGDLVICRKVNAKNIKTGDVICFYDPEGNGTATVTHRVTEIITDETGALAWITKGDANKRKRSSGDIHKLPRRQSSCKTRNWPRAPCPAWSVWERKMQSTF